MFTFAPETYDNPQAVSRLMSGITDISEFAEYADLIGLSHKGIELEKLYDSFHGLGAFENQLLLETMEV